MEPKGILEMLSLRWGVLLFSHIGNFGKITLFQSQDQTESSEYAPPRPHPRSSLPLVFQRYSFWFQLKILSVTLGEKLPAFN